MYRGEPGFTSITLKSVASQPTATPGALPPAPLLDAAIVCPVVVFVVTAAPPLPAAPPLLPVSPPDEAVLAVEELPEEVPATLLGPGRSSLEHASTIPVSATTKLPNLRDFMPTS